MVGIGQVECLLPSVSAAVSELEEASTLSEDESRFLGQCGIERVGILEDRSVGELCVEAARRLRPLAPGEREALIVVGPRAPDVLIGSSAAQVQAGVGTAAPLAFGLTDMGCAGSTVAWEVAQALLDADPGRARVTITFASRPAVPSRVRFPVTVIGDGAYAMTIERDGRPVVRAHAARVDGHFHDLFRIDYQNVPRADWTEQCAGVDRYVFELALHGRDHVRSLVDEVLARADADLADVRALIMQNVTSKSFAFYEDALGVPVHQVCRDNLRRWGHLGAMDIVVNLQRLLAGGDIGAGELVLVINAAPVAAWTATILEV